MIKNVLPLIARSRVSLTGIVVSVVFTYQKSEYDEQPTHMVGEKCKTTLHCVQISTDAK